VAKPTAAMWARGLRVYADLGPAQVPIRGPNWRVQGGTIRFGQGPISAYAQAAQFEPSEKRFNFFRRLSITVFSSRASTRNAAFSGDGQAIFRQCFSGQLSNWDDTSRA
jgi:hypothetical protein